MKKKIKVLRKDVGKQIRDLRKSLGLTQEELGEKAELSYKYIGELERGQVNVSLDTLYRIAEALGVTIGELLPKEKVLKSKVIQKRDALSKLSQQDTTNIKDALKLLSKVFSIKAQMT